MLLAEIRQRLPAPKDAATNLAVFRIVVASLFLTTAEVHDARNWASLSPALAFAPRGWGWALALVPASRTAASVAYAVMLVAAVLGLLGIHVRIAFGGLTLVGLYLLALPLRNGLPLHYEHLVWFAALCAVSPCADALALRRWGRRQRGLPAPNPPPPARSAAYALPLRAVWVLIGMIFFFPGLWKLRAAGLGWITDDFLRDHLYWKWAVTPGFVPLFRIDRHPVLLRATAAGVVAFELSFIFLLWNRWSRRLAVAAALLFHAGARWLMGIDFSGLWLTYVAFIDWDALARQWARWRGVGDVSRESTDHRGASVAGLVPALAVAMLLIAGAAEAGARGITVGWPFACYPTFQDRAPTSVALLAMRGVRADGGEVPLDPTIGLAPGAAVRARVMDMRLLATARTPGAPARFAERWRVQRSRTDAAVSTEPSLRAVRFYASSVSTTPEERGRSQRLGALLYELPLE